MNSTNHLKPLAGIRVLDFTVMPPGAACTVMLADLGAEVIRVESPASKGKPSLVVGQVALSRGKQSLTLDMRNTASVNVLERLAPSIDIVVENARPGSMEERGFGYRQCREVNPGIIWCAITGYGQTGPYAEYSGHDLSYLAHSGLLNAISNELPWQPGMSLALQAGAFTAVTSIQGALIQRAKTGEGAFIDVSLSEAATWFLTCGINPLSEQPLFLPPSPDRRLYECQDGRFVAVACAEPRTWNALCDGLDVAELKPLLHQAPHAQEVTTKFQNVFMSRPAKEWVEQLAPLGAAVTVVNHGRELLDDPHIRARQSVVESAGVAVPASPIRMTSPDGTTTSTAVEAPHLSGEDTQGILEAAGFSLAEISDLEKAGIV